MAQMNRSPRFHTTVREEVSLMDQENTEDARELSEFFDYEYDDPDDFTPRHSQFDRFDVFADYDDEIFERAIRSDSNYYL
jgi:hypothetical protein